MSVYFSGAFIAGRLPFQNSRLPAMEKQSALFEEAEKTAAELIQQGEATRTYVYTYIPEKDTFAPLPQISPLKEMVAVILTDDDADPLIKMDHFDAFDAQSYANQERSEEDLDDNELNVLDRIMQNIAAHSHNLSSALKAMGYLKAIKTPTP